MGITSVSSFVLSPNIKTSSLSSKKKSFSDTVLFQLDAAAELLYLEQEKLIVDRGELEEELMSHATPINAPKVKVRGAGTAGGFGKSSSKSGLKAYKQEAKVYSKTLLKEGVVRIDNVLSGNTADQVREYAYALRQKSEQEVQDGTVKPIKRFANVLLKKDRCDLTIPVGDEIITEALNEVIRKSAVGQTIASILSDKAVLHEFSCLMSDPGSQRQVVHPDTPFIVGKGPALYTCFIALQDVRLDMGPTTWLPGTHTAEAHEAFKDTGGPREAFMNTGGSSDGDDGDSRKDALLKNQPAVLGLLSKGSCAIFDSRCLHCGTANKSMDSRALFYFSFKNPDVGYTGNPASIRSELGDAKVTMKALEDDLESFSKGKGNPLIDQLASLLN